MGKVSVLNEFVFLVSTLKPELETLSTTQTNNRRRRLLEDDIKK